MVQSIKKILLVDDEERFLNSMAQRLTLLGFEPLKASSGTRALEIASQTKVDLAIVDLKMPDMDGLMTITRLKQIVPDMHTVLLTGYGSESTRQKSAVLNSEYFEKDSMSDLWNLIKRMGGQVQGPNRYGEWADTMGRRLDHLPKIIGETPYMQSLRKDIERLSKLDCTVSIQGESGTGKELAARLIHGLSDRKDQKFVAFNCSCFSDDFQFYDLMGSLEESGMSGVRASGSDETGFTGTILLDHVETLPEQTQRQLLGLLDPSGFGRSSDAKQARGDIRFMAATHQDLKPRVDQKSFDKDLFQKLNAISIVVPPLRERRDDIPPLCSYFLAQLNKEFDKNIESISDEVMATFMEYSFPGNVRELKHIIERAVILAETTTIEFMHLPERFIQKPSVRPAEETRSFMTLDEMAKIHIRRAIELTRGNRSKAAEILGISRAALWRKLKTLDGENLS